MINQALAAKAFPNQNPIGRRIRYFGKIAQQSPASSPPPNPAPSAKMRIRSSTSRSPTVSAATIRCTGMTLVLRTKGNPAAYALVLRQTIRAIDPDLAIFDLRTMDTHLSQALFAPRSAAVLFGFAGLMGLLISIIGIYGVINFAVARQTKEIGVRMALGARRTQVLAMVLKQGLLLTLDRLRHRPGPCARAQPDRREPLVRRKPGRPPNVYRRPALPLVRCPGSLPGARAPRRIARADPRSALRVRFSARSRRTADHTSTSRPLDPARMAGNTPPVSVRVLTFQKKLPAMSIFRPAIRHISEI